MPDWTSVSTMSASNFDHLIYKSELLLVIMNVTEDRLPIARGTDTMASIMDSLARVEFSETILIVVTRPSSY